MAGRSRRWQQKGNATSEHYLKKGIDQDGLQERFINDFIGRGVFTTKSFSKGDFLLEYKGELISEDEGCLREESYDPDLGSFLFFFKDGSKCLCVDATFSSGLGRLVNDAPSNKANCNCCMRKIKDGKKIYLALYALREISTDEELRYDYGVKDLPWRKQRGNKGNMQVKDVNIDRKVQSKLQAQVAVDSTRHGNSTDDLQNDKRSTEGQGLDICLTVNAHFPINITTTSEISSMNQNNCITAESLQRFKQWKPGLDHKECWINDEGINAYNALLARKFQKMGKAIYIFSSYFFPRWRKFEKRAPENILHSLCQVNLLEKEAWIIPINHGAHWKVIIVNIITKSICLYDSTDAERDDPIEAMHFQAVRNFTQKVHNFFEKRWNSHDWKQCIIKETPKQCNAFDCGIFALKFVDYAISGKSLSFSQDDIPRFRMEMAREITAMRLRSEDTEPLTEQMHQPVSAPKVSVETIEHILDAVGCKSQMQVPKKNDEADCDNDEDFVSESKNGAKSEEFSYVGSQIPTTLLSHLPTEASLEPQLLAQTRELKSISYVDPDNSFSEDDAALANGVQTSTKPQLLAQKRELKSISCVDPDNSFGEDDAALANGIKTSTSNKRQSLKRKKLLSSSSSEEENCTSNLTGKTSYAEGISDGVKRSSGDYLVEEDYCQESCKVNDNKDTLSTSSKSNANSTTTAITGVSVRCAQTNEDQKRVYDKKQACYYCGNLCSKIARHYEQKHQSEREVTIALSFNKGSPSRKVHLEKLRLLGNYHHNLTVLETGKGELIVSRRPSSSKGCNPDDFLPCTYCLGFIKRQELWKHVKSCKFKPEGIDAQKYEKVQEKAKLLLYPACCNDSSSSLLSKLFATMKSDAVSIVARNDWLIKEVGVLLVEKYGEKQNNLVSQKMRELARLLLQLRETDASPNSHLSDFIKPGKFDDVVTAVKSISKFHFEEGVQSVVTPSLPLKIGHSLRKCVNILRGHALRRKDKELEEDACNFEKLLVSEWSHRVSYHSLTTLKTRKFNKVELLPLAEDLEKLRKSVISKMSSSADVLEQQPQLEVWSDLAQATLARLVMFNKRRGGEASKMLVESYLNRPDWKQVNNPEIMSSLSDFERELSKRLDMVEIRGKRGRKVPVILTSEMTNSIDHLIKSRKAVGIPDENPYVFARPSRQSLQHMRACDCLRKFATKCEPPLSNPVNVTSTKLRKYIATISQVLSLKETEVDWLARHLGHDIRVHRDFYRLHESTIEIAKVSKLLLTVDQGETNKFAGKSLAEIDLNDITEPDLSDTDCEHVEDDDDADVDDDDSGADVAKRTFPVRKPSAKKTKRSTCQKDPARKGDTAMPESKRIADPDFSDIASKLDDDDDSSADSGKQTTGCGQKCKGDDKENGDSKTKRSTKKAKQSIRHKDAAQEDASCSMPKRSAVKAQWKKEEKEAVFKYLAPWIRRGRVPGKLDCEKCISKANGALHHRNWTVVKSFVKNQIDKRKRVLAPKSSNV